MATPNLPPIPKPEDGSTPKEHSSEKRSPEDGDTPSDVEPGSDADIDRGGAQAEEPSPGEEAGTGQMDDNIDDLGRRPDGTTQDQPGAEGG